MFKIPTKQIIVNTDAQVRLLEDDGTVYLAADVTPSAGGFILEGFLGLTLGSKVVLQKAATRIIKDVASAGGGEIAAYIITTTALAVGDVFRVQGEDISLSTVEYQNINLEKRYQASAIKSTNATVIAHIVATINADKASLVIAYAGFNNVTPVQDDSAKLVLVAKLPGVKVNFYSSKLAMTKVAAGVTVYHTVEDTLVVTAGASLPVANYAALKSIDWARNVDFDRNVEIAPEIGANYNAYYFEIDSTGPAMGTQTIASGKVLDARTAFRLYVAQGLTLATKLDLLVTDLNV